jgi:hypothetical protein
VKDCRVHGEGLRLNLLLVPELVALDKLAGGVLGPKRL